MDSSVFSLRFFIIGAAVVLTATSHFSSPARAFQACTDRTVTSIQGLASAGSISLSQDATLIAFASSAALLPEDTNGVADVFVYDRTTCVLEIASVASGGPQANAASKAPSISNDGRWLTFVTAASNLISGDDNGIADVFLRDRQAGTTERVSLGVDGAQSNAAITDAKLSGNGLVVGFVSAATNLVQTDTNGIPDLFIRDLAAGTTERASVATGGAEGALVPFPMPGIMAFGLSNDGNRIAFATIMKGLVPDDTNDDVDVFVRDRLTSSTSRVSVASDGTQANGGSWDVSISGDGRIVAFESGASNLVPDDNNALWEVFIRDVDAQVTTRLTTVNQGGEPDSDYWRPIVSGTGRYIAFLSSAMNLVAGDFNGVTDVFIHDRQTAVTRRATTSELGIEADDYSFLYDISDDGQVVGFTSAATTLVDGDGNGVIDAFATRWSGLSAPPEADLMRNGEFTDGSARWLTFGAPTAGQIVSQVEDGIFEFRRVPAPGGTSAQAVVFQDTTARLLPGSPVEARFDLGSSSSVRQRVSIVMHDADFSDVSVCTFWLEPLAPRRPYAMRAHTTEMWSSASISIYAASSSSTGFYEVDNVSMKYRPTQPADRTACEDPEAPDATGGPAGASLISNGDFAVGAAGWTTFGQATSQVIDGILEFSRLPGTPAGVVLQPTNVSLDARRIVTATFSLANPTASRHRVTVLLHDLDFSDLHACTITLQPGAPLVPYVMRTYTTDAWSNATISFYGATVGGVTQLDNVSLQQTPGAATTGTECIENAEPADLRPVYMAVGRNDADSAAGPATGSGKGGEPVSPVSTSLTLGRPANAAALLLTFESRMLRDGEAVLQISVDGLSWIDLATVPVTDDWAEHVVSVPEFPAGLLHVRFVYHAADGSRSDSGDGWEVRNVRLDSSQR
jgi:Tol biopolymer transport system component